jgi:hypothetical protein
MGCYENPVLRRLQSEAAAAGEIVSTDSETITIRGIFSPGIVIPLHPGARVFVLTEDDAVDLVSDAGY